MPKKSSRLKWIVGIAAVVIVVVVTVTIVILLSYDFNNLKPLIAREVKAATGREITLEGDIELKIGFPLALTVEQVSFQNAPWGSRPDMARIKRFEAEVSLMPLLKGAVEVHSLVLIEPDFLMETSPAGRSNFVFESAKKKADESAQKMADESAKSPGQDDSSTTVPLLGFNAVRVEKGRFTFKDASQKKSHTVDIDRFTANTTGKSEPIALSTDLVFDEKPIKISGTIGNLIAMVDPSVPWPVDLNVKVDQNVLNVKGTIDDLVALKKINIDVNLNGPSIRKVVHLTAQKEIPDLGKFKVSGNLNDTTAKLAVKDLHFELRGKDTLLSAKGSINDLLAFKKLDLAVQAEGVSIREAVQLATQKEIPALGKFKVSGTLNDSANKLAAQAVQIKLGSEDTVALDVTGAIKDLIGVKGLAAKFRIESNDMGNLRKILPYPLPATEKMLISGVVEDPAPKTYQLADLNIVLDDSDLSGTTSLNFASSVPSINATLFSENLDLRTLLPQSDQEKTRSQKTDKPASKNKKVFPNTPLPLDALKSVDAQVKLRARAMSLPQSKVSNLEANLTLQKGSLRGDPVNFNISGGKIEGLLDLRNKGQTADLSLMLNADNVQLANLLKELAKREIIEGDINAVIDLTASGGSIAELMGGLNGKTSLVMGEGQLNNKYAGVLGSNFTLGLLKMVNPFAEKADYTKINCFVSRYDIKDGVAQATAMVVDTDQMSVVASGGVNLKQETLNMAFRPSPKKGVGTNETGKVSFSLGELTRPFKLGGTLAKPELVVDPSQTIRTIGKAVGGVAIAGPVGLAAALANVNRSEGNPCVNAIALAEKEKQPPTETSAQEQQGILQDATKQVTEGTKKILEGASEGLKKLLGQ